MRLNKEYKEITSDILNNKKFNLLKNDTHHGTNKYDHCKRVSYLSFLFAKLIKCNCIEVARGGLLHDFFFGTRIAKEENDYLKHPKTSVVNAKKYFSISENEAKIIESHMYHCAIVKKYTPFLKKDDYDKKYFKENKPSNKESVIVCISDLLVSIFEVIKYKLRYNTALYMLFLINVIRL